MIWKNGSEYDIEIGFPGTNMIDIKTDVDQFDNEAYEQLTL